MTFEGALHEPVFKKLKIQNPSSKNISYNVSIVGEDKDSFQAEPSTISVSLSSRLPKIYPKFTQTFYIKSHSNYIPVSDKRKLERDG